MLRTQTLGPYFCSISGDWLIQVNSLAHLFYAAYTRDDIAIGFIVAKGIAVIGVVKDEAFFFFNVVKVGLAAARRLTALYLVPPPLFSISSLYISSKGQVPTE